MSHTLVTFKNVCKNFEKIPAVKDINFDIGKGEFLAIMGPSGCGKTTTLRMLAGLEIPSSGEIRFNNRLMNNVKPHERDTPLVWQSLALFPFLNVQENVEFGLDLGSLEWFRLTLNTVDFEYSGKPRALSIRFSYLKLKLPLYL